MEKSDNEALEDGFGRIVDLRLTIATSWRTRADSKDLRLQMVAA